MNRSEMTLRIDATFGLKIKPGDKIRKGQHISTNQKEVVTSPVSGMVKSVRFDPDNHKFLIVVSTDRIGPSVNQGQRDTNGKHHLT